MDTTQLDFIYAAGETRRFHTCPVLRERTIAHHSWHVAMLLHTLYGQQEPGIRPVLLMAALTHDMAECKMGDLPSPGKRAMNEHFPDFRAKWGEAEEKLLSEHGFDFDKFLDDEERRKLKVCDNAEGAFYCINERAMGNKLIEEPFNNFHRYLVETIDEGNTVEADLLRAIRFGWRLADER